jgi:hypothetical protein
MTADLPDLPVSLLDRALIEGERLAFAADDLERQVLSVADRTRAGGAWTVTERGSGRRGPGDPEGVPRSMDPHEGPPVNGIAADATRELPVVFEGGACRRAVRHRHRSPGAGPGGALRCRDAPRSVGARRWRRVPGG